MTPDPFFEALRDTWRQSAADPSAIAREFAHRRRIVRFRVYATAAGGGCVMALLVWLTARALSNADMLVGVAALSFAAALPAIVWGLILLLRQMSSRPAERTPLALLSYRRAALAADLRLLAGAKTCAVILVLASIALGVAVAATNQRAAAFTIPALPWLGTAIAVWVWQSWKRGQLARQASALDRLVAELEEDV